MLRIPATLCLLGLGLLARSPGSSRVAPNVAIACDSLKTRVTDPFRYRQRGDRCEGVYAQDVSGSSDLLVASLVESFEAIDDTSTLPLRVEWMPPDGEMVTIGKLNKMLSVKARFTAFSSGLPESALNRTLRRTTWM